MYEIDGKKYVPANPNKKVVQEHNSQDIIVSAGDSVDLTYKQRMGENGPEEVKFKQLWTANAPAVVRFNVKTYDDATYTLTHSVDYVKPEE